MRYWSLFALLIVITCFVACKEDEPNQQTVNTIGGFEVTAPFYAVLVIDGDSLSFQDAVGGYANSFGRGSGQADTLGNLIEVQRTSFEGPQQDIRIAFIETFANTPSNSQVEGMFQAGSYPYGNTTTQPRQNGVEITLTETNGTVWTTANDTSFAGNQFTITEHEPNENDTFTPFATTGNFNCVLYNSNGDSLVIEKAFIRARTVVYP